MKKIFSTLIISFTLLLGVQAQNVWVQGQVVNLNSPDTINVLVTVYDSLQGVTVYSTYTEFATGNFALGITAGPNSFIEASVTDCNGLISADYGFIGGGVFGQDTVDLVIDYCPSGGPGNPWDTIIDFWVEGYVINNGSQAIPVEINVLDSVVSTYNVVSDTSGYFGTTISASLNSLFFFTGLNCNGDSFHVFGGPTPIAYDTVRVIIDYCPTVLPPWPIDTSCDAYFTIQQATGSNGTPVANQAIIYDQSTGSNLQYLWLFGSGNGGPGNVIFDSVGLVTPTYNFSGPGPYYIALIVFSDSGCVDFHIDSVNVDSAGFIYKLV